MSLVGLVKRVAYLHIPRYLSYLVICLTVTVLVIVLRPMDSCRAVRNYRVQGELKNFSQALMYFASERGTVIPGPTLQAAVRELMKDPEIVSSFSERPIDLILGGKDLWGHSFVYEWKENG